MILARHSLNNVVTEMNRGNAFRAQLIRMMPNTPVVMSGGCRAYAGKDAVRASHWLSRYVTHPAAVAACGISVARERSARNIADWSSYLPADCVEVMVSLGWDRTS
jgi:hypothetical protein